MKNFNFKKTLVLNSERFSLKNQLFKAAAYLLLFTFPFQCFANSPKIWLKNEKSLLLKGDTITNGKIELEPGSFSGYDLESFVSDHRQALELARLHSKYNNYTKITFWAGVVPSFIMLFFGPAFFYIDSPSKFYGSGFFYGSLAGLIGTTVLGSHFASLSRHYLLESINTYNGVPQQQQLGQRNDKNTFFASVPVFTF